MSPKPVLPARRMLIHSGNMIEFVGFVFFVITAAALFFGGLYFWIRYVFGEKYAGKVTFFCLKLALVFVAMALLVEPVGMVVGIFWATVEISHGWTLVIPAVLFGLPLVRFVSNRCRGRCR